MENTATKTATKPATKKATKPAKSSSVNEGKYIEAVGRRKTAVARVRFYPSQKGELFKNGIKVNDREISDYFPSPRYKASVIAPLRAVKVEDGTIEIKIVGGGINAQAEAASLGIARILVKQNEDYKKVLRAGGFLTRDSRMVERKKYGKAKARRAHQWRKR